VSGDGIPHDVMPNGSFVALTGDIANQSGPGMCRLHGVRDRRGFVDRLQFTLVQRGCDRRRIVNDTCRSVFTQRGSANPQGAFSGNWSCAGHGTLTLDQQQSTVTATFSWNGGGTVSGASTG
jgi:hypothetical protein